MASSSDDSFSVSAEKYLAKHCIQTYFEDAICQLLEHKEANTKVDIIKFLAEYFVSVRNGSHTLYREYSYIRATLHNRASFVHTFWRCFRYIGKKGDLLSIKEYHSLVCLLCPDFPLALLQKTASIVLLEDATDSPISYADFLFAFQTQFLFDEFIDLCWKSYSDLSRVGASPRDPVIVPSTSGEANAVKGQARSQPCAAGVDSSQLYRQLAPLVDRSQHSVPPVDVLKSILHNTERVTFFGFLLALTKSEMLNKHIGKLPNRDEIYDGVELLPVVEEKATEVTLAEKAVLPDAKPDSRPASARSRTTATSQGVRSTKERRVGLNRKPTNRQLSVAQLTRSSSSDDDTEDESDDTDTEN